MDNSFLDDLSTENAVAVVAGQKIEEQRARMAAEAHAIDGGRPFRVLPNGDLQTLEHFRPAPSARRGQVCVYDADSFIVAVDRFKGPGSMIFINEALARLTCIVDYHGGGADGVPGWGAFRVVLTAQHTPEWARWIVKNGARMNQEDFATFLEDNVPDIAEPAGATLVEMARTFEAKKDVTFHSVIRKSDGTVDFAYREDVQGTMRGGDFKVPASFTLALAPYQGVEKFPVVARLRFKVDGTGKLAIWFDLMLVAKVLETAFKEITDAVAAHVGDVLTVRGPAPDQQVAV